MRFKNRYFRCSSRPGYIPQPRSPKPLTSWRGLTFVQTFKMLAEKGMWPSDLLASLARPVMALLTWTQVRTLHWVPSVGNLACAEGIVSSVICRLEPSNDSKGSAVIGENH